MSSKQLFFVEGQGFVPAGQLAVGNAIVTRAGPDLIVKALISKSGKEGRNVYNIVVEDNHTYFVGKYNGGTWVHNPGLCDGKPLALGLRQIGNKTPLEAMQRLLSKQPLNVRRNRWRRVATYVPRELNG